MDTDLRAATMARGTVGFRTSAGTQPEPGDDDQIDETGRADLRGHRAIYSRPNWPLSGRVARLIFGRTRFVWQRGREYSGGRRKRSLWFSRGEETPWPLWPIDLLAGVTGETPAGDEPGP